MKQNSYTLLLVEDNPRDVALFEEYLDRERSPIHELDHSPSIDSARLLVDKNTYDLVILDLNLEDSNGLETFKSIKELVPDTPIIVLTGRDDEVLADEMIEKGAQDYLVKEEINTHWLHKAIRYAVERFEALQKQQESEHRYRSMFASANDPIYIESFDDRVLDANEAGCKLLGYEQNELIGMDLKDIVAPEVQPDEGGIIENEVSNHGGELFETLEVTRSGKRIPVEVSQSRISFEGEDAAISFVRDISDRKQAEQALQESEQRFRQMTEAVNDVFWMFSPDWSENYFISTEQFEEIFSMPARDLKENGRNLLNAVHPDDRGRVQNFMDRVSEGNTAELEFRANEKVQFQRWVKAEGFPLKTEDGEVERVIGTATEITERKQSQLNLKKRYKEQNCLYSITEIDEMVYQFEVSLLREIASRVPRGYFRPSRTHCRIQVDGTTVTSENFQETDCKQSMRIEVDERTVGQIEVFVDPPSSPRESGFLPEEHSLLEAIATEIASKINRRRSEQRIKEQAEFLDAINDRMPGVTYQFRVSPDGEYSVPYMSEGFDQIAGVTAKEAEEDFEKVTENVHPDDLVELLESIADVTDQTSQWSHEFRYRLPDGTTNWALGSSRPEVQPDGSIVCSGVLIDITDRVQFEQQLLESEKRFRQVAENINQSFYLMLVDCSEILYVNSASEEIFDLPRAEFYKNPMVWLERVYSEDRPEVEKLVAEPTDLDQPQDQEFRLIHSDGSEHWVHGTIYPIRNEEGTVTRCAVVLNDITEQKKAELELRESEERFRQLAENIDEIFWITNLKTTEIVYISPAYEEIWGKTREELYEQPRSYLDSVHKDDIDRVIKNLEEYKASGESYDMHFRIYDGAGEVRWIRDRAFPIEDENENVYRVAGLAEDITEQKQIQTTLEESIEEKELLLQEVHHRVRNNLQLVTSLLGLQQRKTTDPNAQNALLNSKNRIQSMALIHRQLYQTEDLSTIDFSEYVHELVDLLVGDLGPAEIEIEQVIQIESGLELDTDSLIPCGLIVNELVTNSLKHGFEERNQGKISIILRDTGQSYQLVVKDNGIGGTTLPLPDLNQTNSLGLRLVKNLAENQLHGTIELESAEKGGIRFRLEFPPAEERFE